MDSTLQIYDWLAVPTPHWGARGPETDQNVVNVPNDTKPTKVFVREIFIFFSSIRLGLSRKKIRTKKDKVFTEKS